jgi:hypothetical protein
MQCIKPRPFPFSYTLHPSPASSYALRPQWNASSPPSCCQEGEKENTISICRRPAKGKRHTSECRRHCFVHRPSTVCAAYIAACGTQKGDSEHIKHCCCYRRRRCSQVLKTQQQTLRYGSIQTLCLPSKTMIYLWSHSSYNRVSLPKCTTWATDKAAYQA